MTNTDHFERVLTFIDALVLTIRPREDNGEKALHALLMKRDAEPCEGLWSLIGGGFRPSMYKHHEELCHDKIKDKAGIEPTYLEQVYTQYGEDRDQRGPSQTTLYYSILPMILDNTPDYSLQAGSNAAEVKWIPVEGGTVDLDFAFDHKKLLEIGVDRVLSKASYTDVLLNFLPDIFTMSDIINVHGSLFGKPMSYKVAQSRFEKTGLITKSAFTAKSGGRHSVCFTRVQEDLHIFDRPLG